jgi:hypothetical protein
MSFVVRFMFGFRLLFVVLVYVSVPGHAGMILGRQQVLVLGWLLHQGDVVVVTVERQPAGIQPLVLLLLLLTASQGAGGLLPLFFLDTGLQDLTR